MEFRIQLLTTARNHAFWQLRWSYRLLVIAISTRLILIPPVAFADDRLHGWTTASATRAMQLIAVEQSGAVAEFVLKNVSSGTITAFTVTHGGVGHTIDYFQADGDLQPGATYSLKVASEEVSGSDHILNVTCVVFADGKAEGTPDGIDFIKGRRLGRLFEVERVKAILEGQTDTLPVEAGLEAFNAKIGSLPASAAEALQSVESVRVPEANLADIRASGSRVMDGFMLGVRNARQDALWKVKQYTQAKNLRLPPGASPHTLSDLRQFYRGLTTKYHVQLGSRKDGVR